MEDNNLICSYIDHHGDGITVYKDHIDIFVITYAAKEDKSIVLQPYLDCSLITKQIDDVKLKKNITGWKLWFVMKDGSNSKSVRLGEQRTKECYEKIEKLIQSLKEMDEPDEVECQPINEKEEAPLVEEFEEEIPVEIFEKGISKVVLFEDHVVLGLLDKKTYPISEIIDVKTDSGFLGWHLWLNLKDGTSSSKIQMDASEIDACKKKIVELLIKYEKKTGTDSKVSQDILNAQPIKSFIDGVSGVLIYKDRIEIGVFGRKTFQIGEIREVKTEKSGFMWSLWLVMHNGTKSPKVQIGERRTKECYKIIDDLLTKHHEHDNIGPIVNIDCTFLGGTDLRLKQGEKCTAIFSNEDITIKSKNHEFNLTSGELTNIEIDGPGKTKTSAGMIGGGFGIQGILIGMGVATLVNALTSTSSTNTFIHLKFEKGEVFLHTSSQTPQSARLALSHVFSKIEQKKNAHSSDIVSQLERLTMLKNSGALTEEDFESAKRKILGT